jgi:1,2-diacylglycerol 3-beta-glucosyltransferase
MTVIAVASLVAAALSLPIWGYLGFLALLAIRRAPTVGDAPTVRFAVVVPAHNESALIGRTITSLLAVDYPVAARRVVVVADNCTDDTAARSRAAGAEVLERQDAARRGKGYALAFAFERLLQGSEVDAIVVVDADTEVSSNLLTAFAARLGAGEACVQAEYGVRNPLVSWRTRLMAVALGMFHRTRSLARERLGVSVGLRGNGMCFASACLRARPYDAFSVVEDVEYGIRLGLAGVRVAFAHEAWVRGEMVTTGAAALSQRRRWESGRWALAAEHLPRLVAEAGRKKSGMLADLAIDLVVPPLAYIGLWVAVGVVLETVHVIIAGGLGPGAVLWGLALACLGAYVARGVQHSGLGARGIVALLYAPVYVFWKLFVARPFKREPGGPWIRTRREAEKPSGAVAADRTK